MSYREIIAVCSEIHTKHVNTLCGQNVEFVDLNLVVHIVTTGLQIFTYKELYINTQSVPRSKHIPSRLKKTSQLMLYREIIAVCSEIHTKQVNTLCGQNVEFVDLNLVVHIVTIGLQIFTYKELYTKTQIVPRSKQIPSQL